MTNPNTRSLRRDLQLCVASGPDAPPLPPQPPAPSPKAPPHPLQLQLPGASHVHAHMRAPSKTPVRFLKQSASLSNPIQSPATVGVGRDAILGLGSGGVGEWGSGGGVNEDGVFLPRHSGGVSTPPPPLLGPSVSLLRPDYQETAVFKETS